MSSYNATDAAELERARAEILNLDPPEQRIARPVGDRLGPRKVKREFADFFPNGEYGVFTITHGRGSFSAEVDNAGRVKGIPELSSDVCAKCPGRCCTWAFGFTTLTLTPEEAADPLFAPHVKDGSLAYVPGHGCPFMAGGKCTIYARRPVNCRGFMCYNHGSRQIRDAVNAQPALRKMLREEGVLPEKSHSYDSVRAMLVRHRKQPVLQRRAALSKTLGN